MGWTDAGESTVPSGAARELGQGDIFPQCELVFLNPLSDGRYLDLKPDIRSIRLVDIPAEYIFVEFFNERCLGCIREIKTFKSLYSGFQNEKGISEKIKIIGIGTGSNEENVQAFRDRYDIPFPVFADAEWRLFECLGSPALPTAYLLKRNKKGAREIVSVQSGHTENIHALLESIEGIIKR